MNRALGLCLVLLLVGVALGPVGTSLAQEETPTPSANETRHVDPDETNQNGDLGGLQSALGKRMAERLAGSSIQLSQNQYDLANQLVGQEYQDQYGKYVDVAGETDDEDSAEQFETAQERQQEFNDDVQEYNEKAEEYREAKENGNEQKARRLARELDELSEDVSGNGERLRTSYATIANGTGVDMREGREAINRTVANVTETQEEIRLAEFVATNLTIAVESSPVSFADPAVLDGRLVTENGTEIAGREITLGVDNRRMTTRTDETGRFTAAFRPTTTPVGKTSLWVRYLPNETSSYLGARANVSFVVEQVSSTVAIETATTQAGYGDDVTASGTVEAAETRVPDVPVVLTVDGQPIARTNTTADGEYSLSGPLPASIPTGNQTVRVVLPLEERAVSGSAATRELTVTATETNLTVEPSTTASSITLDGTLQTATGEGVSGQELEITRNGSVVATARTGAQGQYEVTISGDAEERYAVAVSYDDPRTNLENASAGAVVAMPPGSEDGDADSESVEERLIEPLTRNPLVIGAGALLLLLALGGGWWLLRGDDEDATEMPVEPTDSPRVASSADDPVPNSLERARDSLDENADAAVERAYTTIRGQLRDRGLGSDDATHWEFFRACDAAGLDDAPALETLTGLYERAAFDPNGVSQADAERALDHAARFV